MEATNLVIHDRLGVMKRDVQDVCYALCLKSKDYAVGIDALKALKGRSKLARAITSSSRPSVSWRLVTCSPQPGISNKSDRPSSRSLSEVKMDCAGCTHHFVRIFLGGHGNEVFLPELGSLDDQGLGLQLLRIRFAHQPCQREAPSQHVVPSAPSFIRHCPPGAATPSGINTCH